MQALDAPSGRAETDARGRRRRRRIRLLVALGVIAVGLTGLFQRFLFRNNFGVVEPGRVYRSAQPGNELEQTVREHSIASVLNLRGGSSTDWWYANEVRTAERLGVRFYDLPLEADRPPTRRELLIVLDLLDRAPYPMLVHCKSGADRTGLAAALYRLYTLGEPPEAAERCFSLDYAHIPLFGPERLHEPLDAYAAWLGRSGLKHTPSRFREWVETGYPAAEVRESLAHPYPLPPGPRADRLATGAGVGEGRRSSRR